MPETWKETAAKLGLNDFSPVSQERARRELTRRRGVNPDAHYKTKEEFMQGISKLSPEWASLPNAQGKSAYDQPVKRIEELWNVYQNS